MPATRPANVSATNSRGAVAAYRLTLQAILCCAFVNF